MLAFAVGRTRDQTPVFSSLGLRVFYCRGLTRDTPLKLDPLPCALREHGIRKARSSFSFTCCLENTAILPSYSQHPPLAVPTSVLCMWHCPRQCRASVDSKWPCQALGSRVTHTHLLMHICAPHTWDDGHAYRHTHTFPYKIIHICAQTDPHAYTHIHAHTYAHSGYTPSQLTNTCSELDSSLLAPSSGFSQVLQCQICTLGPLSCSGLAGASRSDLMPFSRETLSNLSSIVNANIICTMTPHRAQWLGAGNREDMGKRAMFLSATIEGCQPPPVNSWCWGRSQHLVVAAVPPQVSTQG